MNTKTISGNTYTSPTTNDISFFGNDSVTLVLPVYTFTVGSITWRYSLDASNNASIGTGINANGTATTSGRNLSGALIIPSALNGYTVTRIGDFAFQSCNLLTSVTIPNSATYIGLNTFTFCDGLTSLTIPDSVVTFGNYAFNSCTSLTSVTIGNLVTSLGNSLFGNCTGLNSVTLGNSLVEISVQTFYGCSSLTSLTIPDSVTTISYNSFKNCSSLTTLTLGNSVKTIFDAFSGCTSLTYINIPDSVTLISGVAFTTTSANLTVAMNTKTIGGTTYTSPTTTDIEFFGNLSVTLIKPPFSMTITSTAVTSGSTSNNVSIPLTFTSSKATSNFEEVDITLTNGTLSNFAGIGTDDKVYTATFAPTSQGACTINVAANKFTDALEFNNAAATFTFTFDSLSPSMTITSTTVTSGSITNNATIALTFTSNETTNNFVVGDISVTNGSLSNFAGIGTDGKVYTATFTPLNQGVCTIGVAAGAYTDAATNLNNLATQFTFTFDTVSPTMTITSTSITSGSNTNNSIVLTFTSSEATTNFVVGDISVTNGTLSNFAGIGTDGKVYTATFTPASNGLCTIGVAAGSYTDVATNLNNLATQFTFTFDSVSPSMTITSTTVTRGSTTNNKFIELTFTSTESTNNFVVGDISVTNGALSNFAGIGTDGKVYNATFTPANEGICTINVAAGVYTDLATNLNNLAPQFIWTYSNGWNTDTTANHIIKSYVKDFIDVSGSVILRENSNLYVNGNVETAGNLSLNQLVVTADASFNRRIFVGGDVSMNGAVTVSGDLFMNGTVTKCSFNNSSIPKSAFVGVVPDGSNYNTSKIVYDQTFQANDDVSMNGLIVAANNVKVSGNILFGDGTVMNTYDNNILSTNPTVFKSSTFTSLDICGNLVAGSYATSSDYRIKTNVVELDETYTVDKLRPVKYYQTQINREKYGLIAHELQEHYPDLVVGEKDGSELQRVNYTGLIAILINEIKRMKRDLAELESGI